MLLFCNFVHDMSIPHAAALVNRVLHVLCRREWAKAALDNGCAVLYNISIVKAKGDCHASAEIYITS